MTPEEAELTEVGDRLLSIFETGNLEQGEEVILIEKAEFNYGFFAKKDGGIVGSNITHFEIKQVEGFDPNAYARVLSQNFQMPEPRQIILCDICEEETTWGRHLCDDCRGKLKSLIGK